MTFGNRPGQVRFVDVTESSGISRQGQTWGVTLFDFDGDGRLEIYQNNHQQKPVSLFRNLGNGRFTDISDQVLPDGAPGDFHGAVSLDFDNDGDSELFQAAGGDLGADDDNPNKSNRLFVRQGNRFFDRSEDLGLEYLLGRGRVPNVFDFNDDGRLDIIYTGPARPDGRSIPTLFLQNTNGTGFRNLGESSGLDTRVPNGTFSVLADVTGDDRQELLYVSRNPKITIYDTSQLPLRNITSSVLPSSLLNQVTNIKDITVADFNGDTHQDLLITQQGTGASGYRLDSPRAGRAKLQVQSESQALKFRRAGDLTLNFLSDPDLDLPTFFLTPNITLNEIFIGSNGINPNRQSLGAGNFNRDRLTFTLDDSNASFRGRPNFRAGVDRGVYIWFDASRNEWTVEASSPGNDDFNFLFDTQTSPSISTEGFNLNINGRPDVLLTYNPTLGRFVDSTAFANLEGTRIPSANTIAGDFDNDADVDLYIVATANFRNLPNVLLENLGDGRFRQVANAAGSAGTDKGIGDAAVVGDYDINGFLDIVVTNGDVFGFDRPFATDGTNHLFQNQGNGNHSIQIDLEGNGTNTNRDAVGAKVYVTTPNGKRQVREQNGGIHNRGQNFTRLHFGLGDQDRISLIEVIWPNGDNQTFRNVDADQVIKLVQGRQTIDTLFNYEPDTPDLSVIGTSGADTLRGSEFDNVLEGRGGSDLLRGLNGNDRLLGGTGNDTLVGGAGRDTLIGGSGADRFFYQTKRQGGDRIEDFVAQADDILVSRGGFRAGLREGRLPTDRFILGAQAGDSRDRFIYQRNQGRLLFDPDGSGNRQATLIARLDRGTLLTAADIIVT